MGFDNGVVRLRSSLVRKVVVVVLVSFVVPVGRIDRFRSTSQRGIRVCFVEVPQVMTNRYWHRLIVVGLPLCSCVAETVNCRRNKV